MVVKTARTSAVKVAMETWLVENGVGSGTVGKGEREGEREGGDGIGNVGDGNVVGGESA